MNGLKINSVISFKHPLKKSKTFTGKIISINESKNEVEVEIFPIPGSKEKQLVKIAVPEKNIKAVLDVDNNIAKEYKPVKQLDNSLPHSEEVAIDPKSSFYEIFNYYNVNKHDCPCLVVPVKSDKTGETVLKFEWNKEQFDDVWNDECVLPLNAVATENDAAVNITFTQPFSQNFVINKGAPEGTLVNGIMTINNSLDRIIDAVKAKYLLFKAHHNNLVSDAEDYVDAVLNRAVYTESVQQEESEEEQQTQIELVNEKHFELTDITRNLNGITLYRVKCIADVEKLDLTAGTIGGWVEHASNINKGWVAKDATVLGKSVVDGLVKDYAEVSGKCYIGENVIVSKNAVVSGTVKLLGKAAIAGKVSGEIKTLPESELIVSSKAKLSGKITINGNVSVSEHASIAGGVRGLVIDSAEFNGTTSISANGLIQGGAIFNGRNTISGEIKVDTRQAPGSVFSGIESSGSFKIKGAQVVQVDSKPVETKQEEPVEVEEKQQLQESQVIIKEVGPESIAKSSKFKSFGVKAPKQWAGPVIKSDKLTSSEKAYIDELIVVPVDAGDSPKYFEADPEELETRDICIDVAGIHQFYATLNDDGTIDTMWKLEKGILQEVEEEHVVLNEDSIKLGDFVTPKKEFLDDGEEYGWKYEVVEDNGSRVTVVCVDDRFKGKLRPTSVWDKKWIEKYAEKRESLYPGEFECKFITDDDETIVKIDAKKESDLVEQTIEEAKKIFEKQFGHGSIFNDPEFEANASIVTSPEMVIITINGIRKDDLTVECKPV